MATNLEKWKKNNKLTTEADIIAEIVDRCDPNERCFICPAKNYCGNKNGDYAPWTNSIDIDECKNTVKEWANKEV